MASEGMEEHRDVTAFFATRAAADRACENLRSAGFGPDKVKVEEGSRTGGSSGYVVRVAVSNGDYERVTGVLDDETTLSLDERSAGGLSGRMEGAMSGVRDTMSSVRGTLNAGAERLRAGAERVTGQSSDELAAHARETAEQAKRIAADTSGAVTQYVRANPLLALGIAFGFGMLFGMRRR